MNSSNQAWTSGDSSFTSAELRKARYDWTNLSVDENPGDTSAGRNYFGEHSHNIIGYCNRNNQTQLINELRAAYGSDLHVIGLSADQPSNWLLFNPALGAHLPADSEQPISDFCIRHGSALLIVPADLPEDVCSFIAGEVLGMKYGLARSTQALEDVEDKIERVIADCKWTEENIDPSNHALGSSSSSALGTLTDS